MGSKLMPRGLYSPLALVSACLWMVSLLLSQLQPVSGKWRSKVSPDHRQYRLTKPSNLDSVPTPDAVTRDADNRFYLFFGRVFQRMLISRDGYPLPNDFGDISDQTSWNILLPKKRSLDTAVLLKSNTIYGNSIFIKTEGKYVLNGIKLN